MRPVPTRSAHAVLLAITLAVGGVLVACTGPPGEDRSGEAHRAPAVITVPEDVETEPPRTVTTPPGFVAPDTRGVQLLPVQARPRGAPPVPVQGGSGVATGSVQGPEGPVAGATVQVERFLGTRSGAVVTTTGADGRFRVGGLLGGRFRVRAWMQPDLAATESQTFFLPAERGSAEVPLRVERFSGRQLQAGFEVSGLSVGDSTRVRALLTQESVDANGIVVGRPLVGEVVTAVVAGGLTLDGPPVSTTGADGFAFFRVTCTAPAGSRTTVSAGDLTVEVQAPSCTPRATTTTAPTPAEVDVGDEVVVPFPGVLPLGGYLSRGTGCDTTYQVFRDGRWAEERRRAGASLDVTAPVRDLRAAPGTTPCTYLRVR